MEQETLELIRAFFTAYPAFLPSIKAYRDDQIVWESFFRFVFEDSPRDVEVVQPPLTRRAGSTDPRWDELLHKRKALRAMAVFLDEYLLATRANRDHISKEAA